MKLIDANVIIYSMGQEHPYKKACEQIIQQVGEGVRDFIIDAETLQEVLHVFDYRRERANGVEVVRRLLTLFPHVIPITSREIELALGIFSRHPALASRDAIHAAVVQTRRLEGIVTTDKAFKHVRGLQVFDPGDLTA